MFCARTEFIEKTNLLRKFAEDIASRSQLDIDRSPKRKSTKLKIHQKKGLSSFIRFQLPRKLGMTGPARDGRLVVVTRVPKITNNITRQSLSRNGKITRKPLSRNSKTVFLSHSASFDCFNSIVYNGKKTKNRDLLC